MHNTVSIYKNRQTMTNDDRVNLDRCCSRNRNRKRNPRRRNHFFFFYRHSLPEPEPYIRKS